ncbi:hypothetical protein FI667_g16602, partial [Globisporangium splendens]
MEATIAIPGISTPTPGVKELIFAQKRAASSVAQMKFVVIRFIDLYWRTPSHSLTRYVMSIILSLLFGTIFVDAEYASCQGINSGIRFILVVRLNIPPAMESLWVEDEFDATLEEILAFVDSSFDLKDDSTDSNQTSSVFSVDWDRSVHRSSVGDIHTDKPSHKKSAEHCQSHKQCVRRSKSRVENNNAVRKYRKRNKEEIIELRRKLHQMETQLTYLRANRNHARQLENPGGAGNLEFQNLQQARQINRALKTSLAEYTNMSKIPHDLLKKRTTKQFVVFNCVGSKFLVWDRGFSIANSTFGCVDGGELHAIVSAELDHYLGALYLSTLEIARPVAWQEHSETLFATIDPVRGQMYEMTSTTPVNWSVLQLVNYVWSNLTATDCHDHRFMMVRHESARAGKEWFYES